MKLSLKYLFVALLILSLFNCSGKKDQNSDDSDTTAVATSHESPITLTPYYDSPDYADAMLRMTSPDENASVEPGMVPFSFDVKNYQLAAQTADADIKMCANSAEGQHIHLILNNQPYTAHYEPNFNVEMEAGHYVALAFLSRSYHESVKNPEAYVLRQFTVGDADGEPVDLNQPHIFYSRPKGTYSGADTKKVILDFFLVNADLSSDGYKVRATINGNEFMIDEWAPQYIEGLPMGQSTIRLELLDADGNLVSSPYNPVERTITLEEANQPA